MRSWITCVLFCLTGWVFAQCPNTELFDLDLTVASNNPEWINCIDNAGDPDNFTLELISPNDILNYSVDWGDGSPVENGASLTAGNTLPHTYTTLGTFTISLTETQNGCSNTITGNLISDRKPGATAQPPTNNTNGCVPHTLTFINQSTNVSQFTEFLWEWGDGTTTLVTNSTDPGAVGVPINHIFDQGTSGCGMEVRLTARSLCDTSFVVYGPYDFYDIDTASVNVSNAQLCVGDFVTFNDVSDYNCIPGTRRIRWDLSDFGGGTTPWVPAIPSNRTQQFFIDGPVGSTFQIALEDSNFCGVDRAVATVEIIAPPTSLPVVVNDSICEGINGQFENQSSGGANSFRWDYGDGATFFTSNTNTANHVYSDSGSFTVELIADIAGSVMCSDTTEVEIFVKPEPIVSFSTSIDRGCDELDATLKNTSLDLVTWSWDFGSGADSLDQDSVQVGYNTKGYFIVSLEGENDFNCSSVSSDTLLVLPEPKVIFPEDSVCFGEEYLSNNQSTIDEFPSGTIIAEQWLNISGSNVTSLTGNARYPDSPDESIILTTFDISPYNTTNSGYRVQGFIKPEKSGLYKLFIASDDKSVLNLSTNEDPANKVEIASVSSFTSHLQWNKLASQESDFIQLDSGKYYYIEAINKNSGGVGNLSVGWQLPNGQLERPLPGKYLTPFFDGLVINDWSWDFGDGSALVLEREPSHIFNGAGEFNVVLKASTGICSAQDSVKILVGQEIDTTLVFSDTSGCAPLELEIIDSTNAIELQFVYGDSERDTVQHVLGDTVRHTYFNNTTSSRFFNLSAAIIGEYGCSKDLAQDIEVFPIPSTDLVLDFPTPPCAPFELKAGNNDFDTNLSYTWSYKGTSLPGDSSVSLVVENQSVSLRFDTLILDVENADGCNSIEEKTFNVFPEPDYSVVVEPDSGCSLLETEFTLNKAAQSYLWNFGDGEFSNEANPQHTFELTSQDTITYNVTAFLTSPFSCRDTLKTKVFVQRDIVSDFVVSPKIQTYPDTIVQLLSLNTGTILDTSWVIGDSILSGTLDEFRFDTIGDHIITQTVTNQFCSQSHSDTITILPPVPTALFSGGGTGCVFANYQFTNESKFATEFLWDFGDGETSQEENPSHTYIMEGIYNVKLKATGPGGVDSITTFNVVDIVETPVSSFTITEDTLYQPDTVFILDNTSTRDITELMWLSGNEDTLFSGNQIQFSYSEPETYDVSLIVSNDFVNCSDTFSLPVVLLSPLPQASFIGGDTACAPLSVSFTNTSTNSLVYRWDFGDGIETFQENPTHIYDSVGVFNVKLVATNLLGVDSTVSTGIVHVLEKPKAQFVIVEDTLFQPDSIFTFNNISTGNVTGLTWISGDGDTLTNEEQIQFAYSEADEYTVDLIVSNEYLNCEDISSQSILLLSPLPQASFIGGDTACAPLSVTFTNTSTNSLVYRWDLGDGTETFQENPTHVYDSVGVFSVKLVATNVLGVDSTISTSIVQVLDKPTAQYIIQKDTLLYPDTTFNIQNQSLGDIVTNSWSVNGLIDTINNIDFELPIGELDASILTLEVSNNFENCTSSFSDTLFVKPPIPIVDFIASEGGCAPVQVSFTNQSLHGDTYFWDFGDGSFSEQENPMHTYFESGAYNVKLVAFNSSGKDSVIKANVVDIYKTPNALYITNPSNGEELTAPVNVFFNNKSENGTSYLWDFDDGTFSTDEKPLHEYTTPGEYFTNLIVSTDEGCKDTFNLVPPVIVINGGKFVVPNAFSPSPDGPSSSGDISEGMVNNDIFFPKISGDVEKYKLFIYNRWGELLFVSEDPNKGWDGYYKDVLSKQDVYVYRIEIQFETGESEVILGDFSLIR